MQNKDNKNNRKPIVFSLDNVENYTIKLQEMEVIAKENLSYREEIGINNHRLRKLTKELGIASEVALQKNQVKGMAIAFDKLLRENNPVTDLVLLLQHGLALSDKALYEEKLENARLQEELRRIRLLAN